MNNYNHRASDHRKTPFHSPRIKEFLNTKPGHPAAGDESNYFSNKPYGKVVKKIELLSFSEPYKEGEFLVDSSKD